MGAEEKMLEEPSGIRLVHVAILVGVAGNLPAAGWAGVARDAVTIAVDQELAAPKIWSLSGPKEVDDVPYGSADDVGLPIGVEEPADFEPLVQKQGEMEGLIF